MMSFIHFAFRHLRRHWHLNSVVLMCLTLAAMLLASLPSYGTAIASRELDQNLEGTRSTERNLIITGNRYTFRADLFEILQEGLGKFFEDRVIVRHITLSADPLPPAEQTDRERKIISYLNVWSFDKLPESVRVVEGRLPGQVRVREAESLQRPPAVEAVIGTRTAEESGFGIGDRLVASKGFHRLDIVGIVEPLDPRDEMWGEDLSAFEIAVDTSDPNMDTFSLSMIVAAASMRTNFGFIPIFRHEVFWRVLLRHDLITAENAEAVHSDLVNIQTQLGTRRATVSTGLVQILVEYLEQVSRVRTTLFLLTAQAFIFVLYTLAMLTSFIMDRSQVELATLSGRGASAWQITWIFALENLILALPAALLFGPGLVLGVTRLWAGINNEVMEVTLSRETWLLLGIGAGLGWLALVLPVYPAARRNLLEWQQMRARPARLSMAQKLYLDLFLLALGGLLYWQMNQVGSFIVRRLGDTQLVDPLLLLGPSLLLVAAAMIFLRLFPFLLRLVAWAFQRLRGLTLPLGLYRLARDPLKPSRVVLLISLTAGLILFTSTFENSLTHSQEEMAHYLAGADLRVSLAATDQPTTRLNTLPGVLTASPVLRGIVRTLEGRIIRLLAVDPNTFAQVARYHASLSSLKISTIVHVIQPEAGDDVLPAVFSSSALSTRTNVGDQVMVNFAGHELRFRVRGSISNFPTLSGSFVVVSLPALEAQVDLDASGIRLFASREAWLAVDATRHESLTRHPTLEEHILDDTQARLRPLQSDALAQGTSGAFQLNALILAPLSVAVFFLVHFFAARQRVLEFSVLRATGLSTRQLLTLLVTEGVLVLGLGLMAGTVIGLGLSRVMIPYLSRALADSLAGVTIKQILVDWPTIAQSYALLILFYGLALALLLLVLMRAGVHRALRIGDE